MALQHFAAEGGVFTHNVIPGTPDGELPQTANFYPPTLADIGFVDLAGGNYRLASTSSYVAASSEGTAIGVDMDLLIAHMNAVNQSPLSFEPVADAYVRNGSYANTNYGNVTDLVVKRHTTAGNSRESYLKFDLGRIASKNVLSAKLRIYGRLAGTDEFNKLVGAFSVLDSSWTESGIKWSNKPASAAAPLSQATVINATAQWYELDVTSFVQSEIGSGRSTVSLALKMPTVNNNYPKFNSREAPLNHPQLVVVWN